MKKILFVLLLCISAVIFADDKIATCPVDVIDCNNPSDCVRYKVFVDKKSGVKFTLQNIGRNRVYYYKFAWYEANPIPPAQPQYYYVQCYYESRGMFPALDDSATLVVFGSLSDKGALTPFNDSESDWYFIPDSSNLYENDSDRNPYFAKLLMNNLN